MYQLKASNENYEITVEQINDDFPGKWIATFWDKQNELKVDRKVMEYETLGGALEQGFVLLAHISKDIKVDFYESI